MSEIQKESLTKTQVISMIVCTLLLLIYVTLVTWVL